MAVVGSNMIVGDPTPTGAKFTAKVATGPVRIAVSTSPAMLSPVYTASASVDADAFATVAISGLDPETRYYWQVEDNGVLDTAATGQFPTAPPEGTLSTFTFGISSCGGSGPDYPGVGAVLAASRISNAPIYGTVADRAVAENWAFWSSLGDEFYYDLGSGSHGIVGGTSLANYKRGHDDVLLQPNRAKLMRSVPFLVQKDDHDGGSNDHDGTLVGLRNFNTAIRSRRPNPAYGDAASDGGTYYAHEYGGILFISSDTRTFRTPNGATDDASKTMLGSDQKAWMRSVLESSTAYAFCWLMPSQWIGAQADSWASYQTEQGELLGMLAETGWIDRMWMVQGDRHSLAIDTGTHSGFPVLMASGLDSAPLAMQASLFDTGPDYPGRELYGTVTVTDLGDAIGIRLAGYEGLTLWGEYSFEIALPPAPPVPPATLQALTSGSHTALFEARLVTPGQTGDDPEGETIDLLGGDVQYDATADIYANASVSLAGEWPRRATDPLAPYGARELFLRRGIATGDGDVWVSLGYFRLNSTGEDDVTASGQVPIALTCPDRMAAIIDDRFMAPRQLAAGRTVGAVIRDLVTETMPSAVVDFDDEFEFATLARSVIGQESRLELLRDICKAGAKVMHFGGDGRLKVRSLPGVEAPLWDIAAGEHGVLIKASRKLTRERVYNVIVVRSSGADMNAPVQAIVADMDPTSPTYVNGPFGRVPRFYTSPLLTTAAQCHDAGVALLSQSLGMPYNASLTAICNPAIRPWDTARVTYPTGDREVHIMQSVTVPLDAATALTGATREQTRTLIGAY
ncbi:DUF5047 domain-containing protein [Glycomyces paridis]|uniref:DUF5047 domain-containing protein n=1 Tax=Glycomyces paridis TaxID=2126555 RepID=A0A4S8P6W0_9ACTN|nr:DUF5047 domain-containing protein [Glycomyces paridis]THV26013.1 DUF5047 domain-containing protein [Glycomyces paridis]